MQRKWNTVKKSEEKKQKDLLIGVETCAALKIKESFVRHSDISFRRRWLRILSS